jgi:hypothetical protein
MNVWVDGDSMPKDVRAIILRREGRLLSDGSQISVRFVSARIIPDVPKNLTLLVEAGENSADSYIEMAMQQGDLVITRDIPFAERVVSKEIQCMNDRGDIFTRETIAERRSIRDVSAEMRLTGIVRESPKGNSRTAGDTKRFADSFDRILVGLSRKL